MNVTGARRTGGVILLGSDEFSKMEGAKYDSHPAATYRARVWLRYLNDRNANLWTSRVSTINHGDLC